MNSHRPPVEASLLLVDDDRLVTDALVAAFDREADLRVVGTAASIIALEALPARIRRVDMALVDYRLPDGSGADAIRRVRRAWPAAGILAVTGAPGEIPLLESVAAGASGFVAKSEPYAALLAAMRRALRGEVVLDAEAIRILAARRDALRAGERPEMEPLTARERQVLGLLAEGLGSTEICERLAFGNETLRSHVSSILTKTGGRNRLEAVTIALAAGAIAPPLPGSSRT